MFDKCFVIFSAKNAERSARRREKTQESENQARLYVHDVCSLINSNEYGDAIRVTVGGRAFHSSLLDETEEELLRRRMFCSVIVQPATREVSIVSLYTSGLLTLLNYIAVIVIL